MRILGLDVNDYNTSAALLVDGRIVSAAQEERFNREKLTRRFPLRAMDFCLTENGLDLGDLDAVAVRNRSILADPRDPAMKDRVNNDVKFREPFRPFAPSVLANRAGEFFRAALPSPFMEKALPVPCSPGRPWKRTGATWTRSSGKGARSAFTALTTG